MSARRRALRLRTYQQQPSASATAERTCVLPGKATNCLLGRQHIRLLGTIVLALGESDLAADPKLACNATRCLGTTIIITTLVLQI